MDVSVFTCVCVKIVLVKGNKVCTAVVLVKFIEYFTISLVNVEGYSPNLLIRSVEISQLWLVV